MAETGMEQFVSSKSISVFPLSKNRPTDRSSRLFYENNVANIIRQLVDVDGFIIKADTNLLSINEKTNPLEITLSEIIFNLYGYYFAVKESTEGPVVVATHTAEDLSESKTTFKLYASITINPDTREIDGQDDDGVYNGFKFVHSPGPIEVEDGEHILHICDYTLYKENGEWQITTQLNNNAFKKISSESLDMSINRIDGKH